MTYPAAPPAFVLWREVLFAYLAPALCAGIGGLATGRHDLLLAAVTSIAGTSAVVAAITGIWLRGNGFRYARTGRIRLTAGAGIGAAALAALVARLTTESLLPERIRLDFPIAAALAATITTWRWRAAQRKAAA